MLCCIVRHTMLPSAAPYILTIFTVPLEDEGPSVVAELHCFIIGIIQQTFHGVRPELSDFTGGII